MLDFPRLKAVGYGSYAGYADVEILPISTAQRTKLQLEFLPMSELDPSVQREIDALGIPHEVLDCNPEWADTDVFCANYGIPRENAANTILVAAKTEPRQYIACLVTATMKLDVNHKISKLIGIKRLSFASAEETKELTGQLIGGVTVFGLPDSIPLYIDERVMEREYVIVGGGNRSTKIKLAPGDLTRLQRATVADIAVPRQ
jgi:prolyl-tRNA editing enzyme YbaK/EbsC (Cys-tRNA(Pro) deacylase)